MQYFLNLREGMQYFLNLREGMQYLREGMQYFLNLREGTQYFNPRESNSSNQKVFPLSLKDKLTRVWYYDLTLLGTGAGEVCWGMVGYREEVGAAEEG